MCLVLLQTRPPGSRGVGVGAEEWSRKLEAGDIFESIVPASPDRASHSEGYTVEEDQELPPYPDSHPRQDQNCFRDQNYCSSQRHLPGQLVLTLKDEEGQNAPPNPKTDFSFFFFFSSFHFLQIFFFHILVQAFLRDFAGWVPEHNAVKPALP